MKILPYGRSRKVGQIASIIIVAVTIFLFFTAVGIHYAQKQIIKTKTRIAADAGAIYLASVVGSYAHYLSEKYVKGKCSYCKHDWGWIGFAVGFLVGIVTGGTLGVIIMLASVVGFALYEIQVSNAVKALNRQLAKLSSMDFKRGLKWQTISYVVPMIVEDPGAIDYLNDTIEAIVNAEEASGNGFSAEYRQLQQNAQNFWITNATGFISEMNNANLLFDSILTLNSYAYSGPFIGGSHTITGCVDSNGDGECDCVDSDGDGECSETEVVTSSYTLDDLNFIRQKLYATTNPPAIGGIVGTLNKALLGGDDAIGAMYYMYDKECHDEGGICDDGLAALREIRSALLNISYGVSGVNGIYGLSICDSNCSGTQIFYNGDPVSTMNMVQYNLSMGNPIYMTSYDFNNFKQGYIDALNNLENSILAFEQVISNNVPAFIDQAEEVTSATPSYTLPPGVDPEAFEYSWTDKLGRTHNVSVSVDFKMPKVKTKKKFFCTKIKVKRCKQTVHVRVVRNGYVSNSGMRYKANHGVDDNSHWYLTDER